MSENLYRIELFTLPSNERLANIKALVRHFQKNNSLSKSARVRFDVQESQTGILQLLAELFRNSEIKRFLHLQKLLEFSETQASDCHESSEAFYRQVMNILSVLKRYSKEYLEQLHSDNRLFAHCDLGTPVAALHVEERANGSCEIMTLATDSSKLRQGYATKLLTEFFSWVYPQFDKVDLKVDEQNTAAVRLYHNLDFKLIPERVEQWWYASINAT